MRYKSFVLSFTLFFILILLMCISCQKKGCTDPVAINYSNEAEKNDNSCQYQDFDKFDLLTNLTNNYILPSIESYKNKVTLLKTSTDLFILSPNIINLNNLRSSWEETHLNWQDIAFLDFGPSEYNESVIKSGATAISARDFLVAYNVNLNTTSTRRANAVAFDIREAGRIKREGGTLSGKVIKDANGNPLPAEIIARFTEIVAEGKADYVETKKIKGLAGFFGQSMQYAFSKDYDFNFKGETDIYNFVVGLGKKISSGEVDLVSKASKGLLIEDFLLALMQQHIDMEIMVR